ncbi:MAG: VapC toxin protein [Anaerolineae bacterium]|nr:MAG: VapC toxin protein [Anaerolineae bacterium]
MNVVDSSGWLEYFADSGRADLFAPAIEDTEHLLVPVICLYEVFKKILQSEGQTMAEVRAADLLKGKVVEITAPLAFHAALLSAQYHLPMADSLILAVAREHNAILWTQDEHFEGLEGVRYFPKD